MAYIYSYAANQELSDTTSITVDMSDHATGDLLIVVAGKDDAIGGSLSLSGTGWTLGREANQGASGNNTIRYAWWWKWADSDDEASPTISSSDADAWCATCLTIKGAYYNSGSESDFIDIESSNNDTANPYLATGLNTNHDNSLYLIMAGTDGAVSTCAIPGFMNVVNQDSGTNGLGIAWTVIPDASVNAPDIQFYGTGTGDEHIFLKIAIRDSGEGLIPAYPSSDLGTMITPFYGTGVFNTGDAVVGNNNDMPILGGRFDPTAVFQEDASGGPSYVDYTTAATNSTDADVVPYPASEVAGASGTGDCFLIGYSAPFGAVQFDRAGCTQGVAGVAAREYWNGSTWVALKNVYDQTTSFTVAVGDYHMFGFTVPTDWASTTINGTNAYYIRLRCTTLWSTNPTISQIWVGKLALVFDAIAAVADTGVNPFHSSLASSPAATGNVTSGANFNFATTQRDVTSGILVGTYLFGTPRDYTDLGPAERGAGLLFNLGDTSNNHKGWIIGSFGDGGRTFPDDRNIYAVQVGQSSDTSYLVTASAPTLSSCQKVLLAPNCYLGPCLVYFNQLQRIDELVVNGGGSGKPISFDDLVAIANGSYVPLIKNNVCFTPIRFGGDDPIYVDMKLFALSYPLTAKDGGTKVHVDDNVFKITVDARSGDTLKIRNGQFSGKSLWAFTVESTASSGATYDFSGLSIINATVTLRAVTTFSGMSFISCGEIALNGADLADCTISNTKATTSQGAIAFTSGSEADGIDRITFTDNNDGDIGHSIRISAAGTYTFDGHSFSGGGPAPFSFLTQTDVDPSTDVITETNHGYSTGDAVYYQDQGGTPDIGLTDGTLYYVRAVSANTLAFYTTKENAQDDTSRIALSDGASDQTHYIYSAKADVYNASGGAVTINVANGGDTPTIRNSDGSSTTIQNTVSIQVTVVNGSGTAVSGAQVWVQKEADDPDIGHPGNPFTLATGNNQGDPDLVVNESFPSDLPASGWIKVKGAGSEQSYRFASRTGTTFAFNSEVTGTDNGTGTSTVINETNIGTKDIVEGDTIRNTTSDPDEWATVLSVSTNSITTTPLSNSGAWTGANYSVHRLAVKCRSGDTATVPLMNEATDLSGVATESYNYIADKDILVRIRLASGSGDYLPYSTTGTITSSGYSLTATLAEDSISN